MNLHSLFLLMGVHLDHAQFAQAFVALHALQSMASAVGSAISNMAHELVDMAVTSAHAGTHLMGLSAGLGLSVRSVQEWSYVAEQAGTNADAFARGLGMFERNLRSFAAGRGSHGFKEGMAEIGISAQRAKEMLAGPDGMNAALFQVSDHYLKLGVTAERAALNQQLFGARNREIAHDLGRGSALLREQIATIHEIGGILGDKQVDDLKKLDNSIKQLASSFKALTMSVVADLAPQIIAMIGEVTKWIATNRTLISNVLMGLFQALSVVFRVLFGFVRLFVAAMNGDGGAIAVVSLLTTAVLALVAVLVMAAWPIIIALTAALAPLLALGGGVLAAFFLIGAAVIATGLLIMTHWGEIVDFLSENWQTLIGIFLPFIGIPLLIIKHWDALREWFSGFGSWFQGMIYRLGHGVASFFEGLGHVIANAFRHVANLFLEPLQWAINKAVGMLNHLPGVHLSSVSLTMDTAASPPRPTLPSRHTDQAATADGVMSDAASGRSPGRGGAARGPNATFGKSSGQNHVSIGPTTINIHGVKDAAEAKDHIADHVDNVHRHAAAGLGGEVQ